MSQRDRSIPVERTTTAGTSDPAGLAPGTAGGTRPDVPTVTPRQFDELAANPALRRLRLRTLPRWALMLAPAVAAAVWLTYVMAPLASAVPGSWVVLTALSYVAAWLLMAALLLEAVWSGDLERYDYSTTFIPLLGTFVLAQWSILHAVAGAAAAGRVSPTFASPAGREALMRVALAAGLAGATFAIVGTAVASVIVNIYADSRRLRHMRRDLNSTVRAATSGAAALFECEDRSDDATLVHLLQTAARATRLGVWASAKGRAPHQRRELRLLSRVLTEWLAELEGVSADERVRQVEAAAALRRYGPLLAQRRWREAARAVGRVSLDERTARDEARRRDLAEYGLGALLLGLAATYAFMDAPRAVLPLPLAVPAATLQWGVIALGAAFVLFVLWRERVIGGPSYRRLGRVVALIFALFGLRAPSLGGRDRDADEDDARNAGPPSNGRE